MNQTQDKKNKSVMNEKENLRKRRECIPNNNIKRGRKEIYVEKQSIRQIFTRQRARRAQLCFGRLSFADAPVKQLETNEERGADKRIDGNKPFSSSDDNCAKVCRLPFIVRMCEKGMRQ